MSLLARPAILCCAISRMASTDSCCALSIKEQVLTTMMSASSARGVISAPPCDSIPIMTSLSTRFLGQPRLTKPIFLGVERAVPSSGGLGRATESSWECMQSLHFSICDCGHFARYMTCAAVARESELEWYDRVGRALVPRNIVL